MATASASAHPGADHPERLPAPVLPAEDHPRHPLVAALRHREHSIKLLGAAEDAEHVAEPLELGGGLVSEQPGEGQVRRAHRAAGPDDAEPGGRRSARARSCSSDRRSASSTLRLTTISALRSATCLRRAVTSSQSSCLGRC